MAYDPTYPADDIYVKDLPAAIRQKGEDIIGGVDSVPVGSVIAFAGSTAPTGFLICDGTAVSRTTYADLFTAVGVIYGSGDGSTTFNLPDLRGEFIRGLDGGRGVDSNRTLGSAQSSANLSHTHTGSTASSGGHVHDFSYPWIDYNTTGTMLLNGTRAAQPTSSNTNYGGAHTHSLSLNNSGGTEARPRNVALNYIIKA